MEKIVEQGLLYDFYGALLTEHQRDVYEKVVYDNQSLAEIAETEGISKQAVHDLVRRTTELMRGYEKKLGMIARYRNLQDHAEQLESISAEEGIPKEFADKVLAIADEIRRDLK